jgi:hypothetical protein
MAFQPLTKLDHVNNVLKGQFCKVNDTSTHGIAFFVSFSWVDITVNQTTRLQALHDMPI